MSEVETTETEVKEESKSIKESMEILDGLEVIIDAGAEVMADGEVNLSDINALIEVAKKFDILKKAVDNAGEASDEMKDLDEMELIQLGSKAYSLIKKIKEIF